MRILFLTKKQKKKAIYYLIGLARVIHRNHVQLLQQDFESYELWIEAVVDPSYLIDGLSGPIAVRDFGLEEGADNG